MKRAKKWNVLWIALFVMAILQVHTVGAAVKNPLADMPANSTIQVSAPMGKGCDYYTPVYSKKFTMTAKSSNPKVATVEVCDFTDRNPQTGKVIGYSKGYLTTRKGYGKTTITVTVKLNGKTYKKSCVYNYLKYVNPFSSFKIGSTNYTGTMNKKYEIKTGKIPAGKISYKLKSGYKIERIWADVRTKVKEENGYVISKSVDLKNGQKVPANTAILNVWVKDKKGRSIFIRFTMKDWSKL